MECSVCLQTLSAEGSIDEQNKQTTKTQCVARFLALRDCIGLVGIRGFGLGMTTCNVVILRRETVECSVCLQTLSAEGSIDEQNKQTTKAQCVARFLALRDWIGLGGIRGFGLGMTIGKDPTTNRKSERALPCAAAHTTHSRRDID